jgi:dienelactone hydrolase
MAAAGDANVEAAVGHWAPRFIANGIDYNDFGATLARVSRWADWNDEWSRTAAGHEALARDAEARGARASAAEAWQRASVCHHFGKFLFFGDPDAYRRANEATAGCYRRAAPLLDPPAERVLIPYGDASIPGYLRRPPGATRPPVALVISGLDSVKEEMHTFEPLFHARGMATLAFDGPGQGELEALAIEPAFERVVASVLGWLEGRADVDAARVGAVGISLGGYYAARAAAFEPRLRCAASVGGPSDFGPVLPTMPAISQEAFRVRSRSATMEEAFETAKALTLRDAAPLIRQPFAVVFGTADRLIPLAQAEAFVAAIPAPDKLFLKLEGGNHVCNNMPFAWRPLVADWFAEHLGAGRDERSEAA